MAEADTPIVTEEPAAAEVKPLHPLVENLNRLTAMKQFGLVVGLAAVVAVVVMVLLWSQTPEFRPLYGHMTDAEAGDVVSVLEESLLPFKIDERTGTILVPSEKIHDIRLRLASQGIPRKTTTGFELLDKDQGFGVSQFREKKQYYRALEGELGKSVAALHGVKSARVHLAIPKQTVFMRKRKKPSASVLVDLRGGSVLEESRVSAIVHLVSASIPELEASKVTVVDQNGRLLTDQALSSQMGHTRKQFEYTRQVEESYILRIENILEPLMGPDGVRAQVKVELDFTEREQTAEDFSPDPIVRSEHKLNESDRSKGPMGIPGALTNQPPGAGVAPEKSGELTGVDSDIDLRKRQERTRNYEIDKTIRHTRNAPGSVERLSVAVVVDDHRQRNVKGEVLKRTALNAAELAQITKLVKEAVGFQEARGDTVNVINAAFKRDVELLDEVRFWEQDWFIGLVKQILVGLFILALIFGVLSPVLRNLIAKEEEELPLVEDSMELSDEEFAAMEEAEREDLHIEQGESYEEYLELVRNFVAEQPEVATQVIKKWLGAEEGDD